MNSRIFLLAAAAFVLSGLGAFIILRGLPTPSWLGLPASSWLGLPQTSSPGGVKVSGKALVGGPFTLTDHTGKRVTEQDFRGKYMLVFFGFTHCPDICPTELQVITAALEKLGGKAKQVTPVFITVDPKRDTVKQMADYVTHFHDRLVGLTGSEEEIRAAAKAYRVYYAETKDEASSAGYTVDHTSIVYLMGPDGTYLAHFAYGTSADKMAEGIAKHL